MNVEDEKFLDKHLMGLCDVMGDYYEKHGLTTEEVAKLTSAAANTIVASLGIVAEAGITLGDTTISFKKELNKEEQDTTH